MFATLIIGLREGLEAALIVGIIAAFLRRQGRTDALAWMWIGVGIAVAICVAVAVGLDVLSRDLPQRQQEGLETVIGAVAVAMVTYMILWMKRHSRDLKGDLESAASGAVARGSALALVSMAFLAVLREGLETAVFLLAAFNASTNAAPATAGAIIGIVIAVILGYGIYRGGVKLNLSRFFTITGLLLVLVAAGLVMSALRTAHEAGWLNIGQHQVVDLTWLVEPGTLRSSLLTGVFGISPKPTVIEVAGWLAYLLIVGTVVVWPAGRSFPRRTVGLATAGLAAVSLVAALTVFATAPSETAVPAETVTATSGAPVTSGILAGRTAVAPTPITIGVSDATADHAVGELRTGSVSTPLSSLTGGTDVDADGVDARDYQQIVSPDLPITAFVPDAPTTITPAQIVASNGGRLPVGIDPRTFGASAPVVYAVVASVQVTTDTTFSRPLAATVRYTVTATATPEQGAATVLGKVVELTAAQQLSPARTEARATAVNAHQQHRSRAVTIPLVLLCIGLVLAAVSAAFLIRRRGSANPPDSNSDITFEKTADTATAHKGE